ncbi:MAG: hypothetical protein KAH57_11320 [Thermoplasmata archaeon]|nr:hypothetical protein [Thermoplasmata archaeon]
MKQAVVRVFALVSGVIFLLMGIVQLCVTSGIENDLSRYMLIAPDPILGAVLLLIGAVFLAGTMKVKRERFRLFSFTMVAVGLVYLLSLMNLLLFIAGSLDALMGGGELVWRDHVGPGAYLVIIPIIGSILLRQMVRDQESIQEGG